MNLSPIRRLFGNRGLAIATTVVLLIGGLSGFAGISLAAHPEVSLAGSNFEIDTDANLKDDDGSPSVDWASVSEMKKDDQPSGSGDDSFKASKEADADPTLDSGSIPPSKSDLKAFGIYQEASANGRFMNMYWSRVQDPSGTTNMDFEFNKKACTAQSAADCSTNGVTPERTAGDLLVTYDLDHGGDDPTISLRTWTGTVWGPEQDLTAAGLAVGSINTSAIPAGADGGGVGPLDPFTFGEAQVDLSIIFDATRCESFGSAFLKSRSSTPITAELKDFIAPLTAKISNCGSVKIKKVDDKGNPLNGAEFTLYEDKAPVGGSKGAEDTVTSPVKKCTTAGGGECLIEEVLAGEYWVVETVTPPNYDTAAPQHVKVVADTQAGPLTFTDPRHTGKIKVVKLLKDELGNPITPDEASDLDGAAFLAFVDGNADGTYQAGEEAKRWDNGANATCTVSGGAGSCEIGPLATGTYGVHETAAPVGTKTGSDIFPVLVVKNTTVTVNYVNSLSPLNITLDKSGENLAHVGDTVHYTFKATTSGPKLHDITLTELVDNRCDGALAGPSKTGGDTDGFLEVGETWAYGCDHVVTAADPDPLNNEAEVTGTDDFGRKVSDTDTHTVLILKPAITLDKKVSNGDHKPVGSAYQAHVGEALDYAVTITNTGDAGLEITALSDTLKANLPASCSAGVGSTLVPNGTITCTYTTTAAGDANNVASVTGVDDLGGAKGTVSASDETFVDVIHPEVEVTKDGPALIHAGNTGTFTFKVTNTGDVDLNDVYVTDDRFGAIGTIASLPFNTSQSISKDFPVPGKVVGPNCDTGHYNVATVTGEDPTNTPVTPDTDDHCTELADPKIEVTKSGPGQVHAGDTATFTFKVTNTGNVALTNVVVTDDQFGSIGTIASLAVGATQTISKDFVVPGLVAGLNCPDGHYNVATAKGTDPLDKTVTDTDDHCTDLADPKIEVTKNGPAMVHAGDTATYTFKVTNIGDVPLTNVVVTDNEFGAIGTLAGTLGIGQSQTISKDFTVPGKVPGINCDNGHYNVATANGTDLLGKTVTDTDDHCTTVIDPKIEVTKSGPGQVHAGDTVTYSFEVTNTGDVDLTAVEVTDDKFGAIGTIASLDVGESTTLSKDFVVPGVSAGANCDDGHHNVATASGTDPLDDEVSDTDDHCATVIDPAIEVVKDGAAMAHEGDTVTYTFKVTNVGDVPLVDVQVTDDIIGDIGTIAGPFDVGETETLSKDFVVPVNRDRVDNVATACGDDPTNLEVCDDDPHSMIVIHSSIELVKTADPEAGGPRDVTYTYVVTNTGDTTITDILVTDDILGDIGTIDELAGGEGETLTRTVAVDGTSPTVNIGDACGEDALGLEVCDTDDAEIAIVLANVEERPQLPRTGFGLTTWLFVAGLALALGATALNWELAATNIRRSRAGRRRGL